MLVLQQPLWFYMVYTVVLNASYEIKSCLSLNNFIFSYYNGTDLQQHATDLDISKAKDHFA